MISTRSISIAACAGFKVSFGARDPVGPVSEQIFMAYANPSTTAELVQEERREVKDSVAEILSFCGGLPIALSITGCTVALFDNIHGSFKSACAQYAIELENTIHALPDEKDYAGKSLSAGILLSLKTLDTRFSEWKQKNAPGFEYTATELYNSLCILDCRCWVPVSVLSRMWKLENHCALYFVTLFWEMSLCMLSTRMGSGGSTEEKVLELHILQLEFCWERARLENSSSRWHSELLNGYLSPISTTFHNLTFVQTIYSLEKHIVAFAPRPWWSLEHDGYIHANLARHLSLANLNMELAALVIDCRWSSRRMHMGGILALEADFACLKRFTGQLEGKEGDRTFSKQLTESFNIVFKAMLHTWRIHSESQRTCLIHIYRRLYCSKKDSVIFEAFLESLKIHTSKAYVLPGPPQFPEIVRDKTIEVLPTACSPCGRYIAAGYASNVAVIDARTSRILRILQGKQWSVTSVTFAPHSKKIIVGSLNERVLFWEWEMNESSLQFLNGFNGEIFCVDMSRDGRFIFAGDWYGSLTIWNASTGSQTGKFQQSSGVHALSVSPNGQRIALGLGNGSLKLVDSSNGKKIFEWPEAHKDSVMSVAFCPRGRYLASGSRDENICLRDTQLCLGRPDSDEECRSWVVSVAFSPNEEQIVSFSDDCMVRLWSALKGESRDDVPEIRSYTFSSDGNQIIFGSRDETSRVWIALLRIITRDSFGGHGHGACDIAINRNQIASGSKDKTIRIWDAGTGALVGAPLRGHTDAVRCVSWSNDGGTLVSGSLDCTVRLWDITACRQIRDPLTGHTREVLCISFSSDDRRIVSGSKDKTVRLWNARTGAQIAVFQGSTNSVRFVSESSDGAYVVSRDSEAKTYIIWRREGGTLVWRRAESEGDTHNVITDNEAKDIIHRCSTERHMLWPKFFSVYCERDSNHVTVRDGRTHSRAISQNNWNWKCGKKENICCRSALLYHCNRQ